MKRREHRLFLAAMRRPADEGPSPSAWVQARQIIEHEDRLINSRLGWMFAFNGFLFAALGFSLSAESSLSDEPRAEQLLDTINALRLAVGAVGIAVSVIAWIGLVGAFCAIQYARHIYHRHPSRLIAGDQYITGPGKMATAAGYASTLVPVTMTTVWAVWIAYYFQLPESFLLAIAISLPAVFLVLAHLAFEQANGEAAKQVHDV